MSYSNDSDGEALQEPPQYDMLVVKFRGDNFEIRLPYCEVANGKIDTIGDNSIKVILARSEDKIEEVDMTFDSFAEAVEKTFDVKEIVKLVVQKEHDYTEHLIYSKI